MRFISEIICRDKFVIEYGSHVRDALIIVLEGRFSCTIHGKHYDAGPMDACFFRKDTLFERKVLVPLRCVYIQFEETPAVLRSGLLTVGDPERAKSSIRYLTQAVETQNRELIAHYLQDILYLLQQQPAAPDPSDPIVSGCIAYFGRSCGEHITLEQLSRTFSISKQALIQRFRLATRKTPMEYLSYVRIDQSKLLLRDTAMSVSQIAEQCGFDNVYYFSNCFKRATGLSPSAYRKLLDL